jgi:hypothetical protein
MDNIFRFRDEVFIADISPMAKLVAFCLAHHYRQGRDTYPSLITIMEYCGIKSKHTVTKALKELEWAKLIKITKKQLARTPYKVNCYELLSSELEKNNGAVIGATNGAINGAINGAVIGAINTPNIREKENKENIENKDYLKKEKEKEKNNFVDFDFLETEFEKANFDFDLNRFWNYYKDKALLKKDLSGKMISWDIRDQQRRKADEQKRKAYQEAQQGFP